MAIALDPQFPELSKGTDRDGRKHQTRGLNNPEFALSPSHEFNFWMDPEASSAVLHAHWPRVVVTTVDISVKTLMDKELIEQIRKSPTPAAQYVAKYASANFLWDELAAVAWLDHRLSRNGKNSIWMLTTVAGQVTGIPWYGGPGTSRALAKFFVEVQDDLDQQNFYKEYVELLTRLRREPGIPPETEIQPIVVI